MIRLTVEGLNLLSDGLTLLDNISIEARPGQIHLLLGRQGSGKTLLGRTLAGLEPDATGEIYLDGKDIIDIPPGKRRVAWVASDRSLWPGYSVQSNLEFGLKQRRIGRQERKARITEALGWFGADSLKNRRAETLSLFESRRVALARALVVDPQVLIIDEPLANLEQDELELLRDNIIRVQSEQRMTTVLLTRSPQHWWPVADRITLLDLGRVIQTGPAVDILQRPSSRLAASFFDGSNIFQGEVEALDPNGEVLVRLPLGRLLGKHYLSQTTELQPGSPVQVIIRPESITLGSMAGTATTQTNRVPVQVSNIIFEGPQRRIQVSTPGDQQMEILASAANCIGLQPGQSITALISADHVSVVSQ